MPSYTIPNFRKLERPTRYIRYIAKRLKNYDIFQKGSKTAGCARGWLKSAVCCLRLGVQTGWLSAEYVVDQLCVLCMFVCMQLGCLTSRFSMLQEGETHFTWKSPPTRLLYKSTLVAHFPNGMLKEPSNLQSIQDVVSSQVIKHSDDPFEALGLLQSYLRMQGRIDWILRTIWL